MSSKELKRLNHYPELVTARYQLNTLPSSSSALLDALGKSRGCLKSGGIIDRDRVSKILLAELRAGKIGRLSFETPVMMEVEIAELIIIQAEKAAKKEAKKLKNKRT